MTRSRIIRADVEQRLRVVKSAAAREGLVTVNYGGATFDSLHIWGANGTYSLIGNRPGETGSSYDAWPRGLREIDTFLRGMYDGIDAARHTADRRPE